MNEQTKLTPVAALRVIAGEHYSSAQYARDLARGVLLELAPAAALELGTATPALEAGGPRPVLLTDDELEHVIAGLCEQTVERRRFAAKARSTDAKQADAALKEMMAAAVLMNRLSLELMQRRSSSAARDVATLEAMATCAECGGRGGRHEIDCDLRPLEEAP